MLNIEPPAMQSLQNFEDKLVKITESLKFKLVSIDIDPFTYDPHHQSRLLTSLSIVTMEEVCKLTLSMM